MLFITEYRVKDLTREDTKRLMDVFAKRPQAPGEIAHYAKLDGSGGIVVAETDDVLAVYEQVLAFDEFLDVQIHPVLKIEDAVGPILRELGD